MRRWLMRGALGTACFLTSAYGSSSAAPPVRTVSVAPVVVTTPPRAQVLPLRLPAPTSTRSDEKIIIISETWIPPEAVAPAQRANPATTALPPANAPTRFPRAEPAPKRKSFVDLSAAPCFSRAADYNWIVGQVEYSNIAKEWRLRYASVDEVDRYGGRVTLIENHHVGLLREGMYVHVRGHLVNRDNTSNGPTFYRVEWFQAVDNPNAEQSPPSALPRDQFVSEPLVPMVRKAP